MNFKRLTDFSMPDQGSLLLSGGSDNYSRGENIIKTPSAKLSEVMNLASSDEDPFEIFLEDEFSEGEIKRVITGVREMLVSKTSIALPWANIEGFLVRELDHLSDLKEKLVEAERKLLGVQGKIDAAMRPEAKQKGPEYLMACAMLLAEKEMLVENLQNRIQGISSAFVREILADLTNATRSFELELRLLAAFSKV